MLCGSLRTLYVVNWVHPPHHHIHNHHFHRSRDLFEFSVVQGGTVGIAEVGDRMFLCLPALRLFSTVDNTRGLVFGLIGSLASFMSITALLLVRSIVAEPRCSVWSCFLTAAILLAGWVCGAVDCV